MKFKNNLHNSDNVWKRRLAGYYNKFLSILYYNPLRYIGSILGAIFSKMPIMFSSSLMQSLKLITNMPISLNIKVVVERQKDLGRAQFCNKERLTCEWIKDYYKKGDVIYDIGANIGAVSLIAAINLKKDCQIYSFEPLPTTFSMLFKNIMLNNCSEVIIPLNIALSDKVKIDYFYLNSIDSGSSGHSVSSSFSSDKKNSKKMTIFTQTLDNLIKSYGVKKPNHIKIDVDGHDYEVLLGGKQSVLNYPALKTILIEKNDKEEQIVSLLKKHGFNKVKLIDHSNKYGNIGFVREDLI